MTGTQRSRKRNMVWLRVAIGLGIVGIPALIRYNSRKQERKSQIMSLIETQFKVSPSDSETSCIEKKSRGVNKSTMTSEVGKILDKCLSRDNRAQTLGKLFADTAPAETQTCVGNKLVEKLSFESLISLGEKAAVDPTDADVVKFESVVEAASRACGVSTTTADSTVDTPTTTADSTVDTPTTTADSAVDTPTTVAA